MSGAHEAPCGELDGRSRSLICASGRRIRTQVRRIIMIMIYAEMTPARACGATARWRTTLGLIRGCRDAGEARGDSGGAGMHGTGRAAGAGVRRAPHVGTSYAACGDRRVGDGAHPGGHDADGGGQPAFVLVVELVDTTAESGFWIGRTPRGCPARRWRKGLCWCGFFSPDPDLGFDGLVGDGRAGGT